MTPPASPRVLFVSYNSLIEPLGPTQVVPYVEGLSDDYRMSVLSFEKPVRSRADDDDTRRSLAARLREREIDWIQLPYHKTPSLPATLYDIGAGFTRIQHEHRRDRYDLLHARGYVPGAIACAVKRCAQVPFLFDIRGLQAEEYVDAGHWNARDVRFKVTKYGEQKILRFADGIVTLTEAIKPIVREFQGLKDRPALPPWRVIPSCVNLEHFKFSTTGRQRVRQELGLGDRAVLVYAGSVGTWYLLGEMLDFFAAARKRIPDLFFLLLINRCPDEVETAIRSRGILASDAVVRWARHEEMPDYLSAADAGIAFIRQCLSKLSSSPTKYGEFLACGLPLVINAGIGDADGLVRNEHAGVLVRECTPAAYAEAASDLGAAILRGRAHYRQIAERHFSLTGRALPAYRELYSRILARRPDRRVLFLTPYPLHCAPSQRLKFEQYYQHLEDSGIQVVVSPFVARRLWNVLYQRGHLLTKIWFGLYGYCRRLRDLVRASRYDAVYVHLWSLPFGPPWFEELLHRRGVPILYDIDDLIYLPRASSANRFLTRFRKEDRIVRILKVADHVIVCTDHLERFVAAHNPRLTRISSTIDTDVYFTRSRPECTTNLTIGWSGSHSTAPYLYLLGPVMRDLTRDFGVRLLVIGEEKFALEGVHLEARPWTLERETADLAEMDIGVYPLLDEKWVLGKSGLKALQYMGMGVPVVASNVGAAREFIDDGENGFLASTTEEWIEKLTRLIGDPDLRLRMGLAGRRTVEERFSVRVNAATYVQVVRSVFRDRSAIGAKRVGVSDAGEGLR